ncbi:uncharacterized protein LOC142232210 isoform X2 [Haematobia irritans]|uniref:uncharacterized protein LOC142232210 isoform X2 n=1 Tax=Haematobia irritans TaxID=7368 RepID=UPI003F501A8D
MLPQQYCLRWKYHHSNLQTMFSQLLDRGCFCDVTLACDGQLIKAHRVVLCACSTFFDTILTNYSNERDPIIIMKDISFADIKCLIEFMYKGEINVEHANLASLLKTADDLKIKGLAEVTWRDEDDGPPPPTPQTEFHSPPISRNRQSSHLYHPYGRDHQQRSHSPEGEHNKTPSPKHGIAMNARMPTLTPIPPTTSAISVVAAVSPNDAYLGPKRKRGRPPLDDSYDVFNVRKLAQYSHRSEQSPYLDASQYADERSANLLHGTPTEHSRPNSPSAAEYYQHHVQQHKHRMRYRSQMHREHDSHPANDDAATEPEWITSSMEVEKPEKLPIDEGNSEEILSHDKDEVVKIKTEQPSEDSTSEHARSIEMPSKDSNDEDQRKSPRSPQPDDLQPEETGSVPQTVEEMENKQQTGEKSANANSGRATPCTSSTGSSATTPTSLSTSVANHRTTTSLATANSGHSHHHSSSISSASASTASSSNHHQSSSHGHHALPPPPLHHPHHPHQYGKYVPDGYMINEHGILMTHDFIHAPTATIPTSSSATGASTSNGNHAEDYSDIKADEFNDADFRLTSEEMSEWQDVIKMDDYLAKGRRPQFWEEPFTRRVLDAIKNKRLEMKKAARILGVSYGTLYGRYREVYGCLKHPYSTSMRPYQGGQMQHRFDIVWPSPKPGQMGKCQRYR